MSSFVFEVFKDKLLAEHHSTSFWTSSLYPEMSPITVVPSANLIILLVE